jgi:hypothetical protein
MDRLERGFRLENHKAERRTYTREFRTAEAARKYAEKNLMPNIDVIGK